MKVKMKHGKNHDISKDGTKPERSDRNRSVITKPQGNGKYKDGTKSRRSVRFEKENDTTSMDDSDFKSDPDSGVQNLNTRKKNTCKVSKCRNENKITKMVTETEAEIESETIAMHKTGSLKRKKHKCDKCNYSTVRSSDIKRHISAVHLQVSRKNLRR